MDVSVLAQRHIHDLGTRPTNEHKSKALLCDMRICGWIARVRST